MVGSIAFSGKAIIVKLAYRYQVDVVTLLMYRMLFSLPLFLAIAWWAQRGREPMTARDWRVVAGLGFCGYYLASFLDFAGLQYISAGLERLIIYLTPTLVLALEFWFLGRRVRAQQMWALGMSYLGAVVVFVNEVKNVGPHAALGSVLVFGSALSYAVYLAFSSIEVKRLGALRLTGWASTMACFLCVAQFAMLRPLSAAVVAPEVIALSVLNAVVCTFFPVVAVMLALERIGAAMTSQVGMIGPLSTILMGILILGEPLTIGVVVGTVMVMVGIWLLLRTPSQNATQAPTQALNQAPTQTPTQGKE